MKLDQQTIDEIIELKSCGFSSREIALRLGVGKSTVNDVYNRKVNAYKESSKTKGPRLLFLDIETAAAQVLTFGRFKQNIGQANVIKEGGWLLCGSYIWSDEPETVVGIYASPEEVLNGDDSHLVSTYYDLYNQADAIVAHNSQGFDHKVIQTRGIYHGLGALPNVKVIDTLVMAKKYLKLPSNRLDSIGEYFGLGRKIDTGGIELWKAVQSGDEDAMRKMVEYCQQDTMLLYHVYTKLRALGTATNMNVAMYQDGDKVACPTCGSHDIHPTGRQVKTATSSFDEYRCDNCGGICRSRIANTTKEDRKKLLAPAK